jgi:TPR repeat protein
MARLDFSTRDVVEVAAQGGGADALYQLGLMYCTGREVEIDLVSAHKWFNLAAMRGNDDAKRYRIELASEMTKAQVASAQKAAREWLKRH